MREQIEQLEDKIQALSKKEKILLAVAIPLVIMLLFYFLYVTDAIEQQQSNKNHIAKLDHNLKKHATQTLIRKIQASKQKILTLKSKIVTDSQHLNYLNAKLAQKDFLSLSQKDFNYFLNNLLEKSVRNNFLINDLTISTKDKKYIEKIKYKRLVSVSGSSEFLNAIKFIREVEENSMLFEIRDLNIETNGTMPRVTYNIDFYGIEK